MANPKDEFDRQQQAVAPTGQARSLAASTDPNNASRLAKVPAGIGGNPIVATSAPPAPVVLPQSNPIVKTATSVPQTAPSMRSASSPSNIYPQSSPSAGANVYGGAGFSRDQFGSSGQFAQVPSGIGGNPLVATAKPNSFGDAAAAANTPGVAQVGAAKPSAPTFAAAAPRPAGAEPAQQAYDAGYLNSHANPLVNQIPVDAGRSGPVSDGSANSMLNSDVGRNVTNTLASLPGAAAVPGAAVRAGAMLSGALGSAAPAATIAGRAAQVAGPLVPPAALAGVAMAGQSQGGGAATGNAGSALSTSPGALYQSQGVMGPPDLSALGKTAGAGEAQGQHNYDRTGMTNALVAAANPGGRVTMTRQPDGTMAFSGGDVSGPVSYMNAAGNPLVGGGVRGSGFSRVDSAPAGANVAMGPNGSFAYASGNPIVSSSGQPASAAAARQPGITGSPAASGAVDAALAAAAQRGDFDAVRAHYAGRGQEFGGQGAAQGQSMPAFEAPVVRHSGNDWAARNALRNLEVSASSISNRPEMRGGAVVNDRGRLVSNGTVDPDGKIGRFNAALNADLAAQGKAPELQQRTNETNAGLQGVAMREQGENYRAAGRNALAAAGMAQHSQELQSQAQLRNLEVQRAQRSAGILQRYDSAKDDAERAAIIRQHPDAFGLKTADPVGKDRYITGGGGTSVVNGQTVKDPEWIYDTVTQQYVGGAEKSLPPMDASKQAMEIRDNPKLTWDEKKAALQKLGY